MGIGNRKKERRKLRKERNIAKEVKHKQEAWDSGKLIEENHNQGPYSEQYTKDLAERLWSRVIEALETQDTEKFITTYQGIKAKIRDLIIYWNPEVPENTRVYQVLKLSLELYWDKDPEIKEKLWQLVRN